MEAGSAPPILSTPADHVFQDPAPTASPASGLRLSDDQLYEQYEVHRTIGEIRAGKWRRVALQFPDEMLGDAPRVCEILSDASSSADPTHQTQAGTLYASSSDAEGLSRDLERAALDGEASSRWSDDAKIKFTILGDTSYGACCVDEVAAEHVDADVVVHYGRACLSPTARLPVIYVYTTKPLDVDLVCRCFKDTYPDTTEKVCLMADIPYSHHVEPLRTRLKDAGYLNVFGTEVVHDPASPLPNRTLPENVSRRPTQLREYSVFHISSPPTSLLLILSSRVKRIHVMPTNSSGETSTVTALEQPTSQLLRRRYALVTRLGTVPVFGILINTLSVANYIPALRRVQDVLKRAGKKSYTVVVGKLNAAKVANFHEVEGWVVIGCWESSLIDSKDFWRPIITPFELEVALAGDESRTWGDEWISDFSTLLRRQLSIPQETEDHNSMDLSPKGGADAQKTLDDQSSDEEPPEFDFRTGRYVSNSRPMGRSELHSEGNGTSTALAGPSTVSSAAMIRRADGDVATINGVVSPAAEFLRSKRTWQGLGSDYEISYERDEDGNVQGATVEEGRHGIAKGYVVGGSDKT